jgi:hypothetical protein
MRFEPEKDLVAILTVALRNDGSGQYLIQSRGKLPQKIVVIMQLLSCSDVDIPCYRRSFPEVRRSKRQLQTVKSQEDTGWQFPLHHCVHAEAMADMRQIGFAWINNLYHLQGLVQVEVRDM